MAKGKKARKAEKEARHAASAPAVQAAPAAVERSYDAARPSRATAGWRRPATSARSETYVALRELRAGSHDTVRNNPHGANVL